MAREYTYDEAVTLITVDEETGDETSRESYAEIVSVRGAEVYQALSVGLKPELMVVLPDWDYDYAGETQVVYRGDRYRVIRAYKTEDLRAELTVTRLRADVSGSDTDYR